jgi:hypothetical protein
VLRPVDEDRLAATCKFTLYSSIAFTAIAVGLAGGAAWAWVDGDGVPYGWFGALLLKISSCIVLWTIHGMLHPMHLKIEQPVEKLSTRH